MERLGNVHRSGEAIEREAAGGLSRRELVRRAGLLGAALATVDLAALLDAHGLLPAAGAQTLDVARDTYNALVAFVVPGDDAYSVAQGERANGPGGLAAGAAPALIAGLDHYVPAALAAGAGLSIPASGAVAALLNNYAQQVNPAATRGGFVSHFARLSFDEKARVFELFEGDSSSQGNEFRFVAAVLPGFAAFLAFSETGVRRPGTHKLSGRPVGWRIARYSGPAEGHRELRGYYRGHRRAIPSRRRRKRFHPRGRRTRGRRLRGRGRR